MAELNFLKKRLHSLTRRRAECPEKQHLQEVARQETRMDMLQDQILKLQDRFDYFIMTQIKQGKMRIGNFGSRKDTDEPHFDATTQNEQ